MKIASAFELYTPLIKAVSQNEVKLNTPRPPDVSLDISKAVSLGFNPARVNEELKLISSNKYF